MGSRFTSPLPGGGNKGGARGSKECEDARHRLAHCMLFCYVRPRFFASLKNDMGGVKQWLAQLVAPALCPRSCSVPAVILERSEGSERDYDSKDLAAVKSTKMHGTCSRNVCSSRRTLCSATYWPCDKLYKTPCRWHALRFAQSSTPLRVTR